MRAATIAVIVAGSFGAHIAYAQTPTTPAPTTAPPPAATTQPAPPPLSPAPAIAPAAGATMPSAPAPSSPVVAAPTRQMTVSALTEKDLTGSKDGEVGEIESVVEGNADKKQFLVISRGGFLGLFQTEVLVPLDNVAVQGEQVVLRNMSEDQVKGLRKFESGDTAHKKLEDTQSVTLTEQK